MNVEPFPVRKCLHYLDMVRCSLQAQPARKRKAHLRQIIEQHRHFLLAAGVAHPLIERELRDLELAVSKPPSPSGDGTRIRPAA